MTESLVEARGLTKKFDEFVAVDNIDFDIHKGEAFGFLGPNGAGKTSTMKMITTVSPITEGKLTVFGIDPTVNGRAIRQRIGVVPQEDNLDLELTVAENLYIYGRYHDMSRAEIRERITELLEFAQLSDRGKAKVEALSGGMKRRLTIARALINDPELVILDEPTTGLDPQARHVLWDRLYRLKQQGATLIITTHYMDEAEQLCDRLVVMDKGKIVAEDSPRKLIETHAPREVVELRFEEGSHDANVLKLDGVAQRSEVLADRVLLYTDDADDTQRAVESRGVHPEQVLVRRSTLEDVFLRLTGRRLID
ncbi:MAG: ABC transporter ATP-binding protein [Acidimicrobiia bacterium]|nr:ABC transporter ATP-binding protein [Acidimicrobiia bacterium]MDH3463544.1 ABC transporter ATP-binding protein [Acidimicrobiia bacterium]